MARVGLRVKKPKCKFMAASVEYLGYLIDEHGLQPLQDKIRAIRDAPTLTNVTELKSYLGLLSYYGKFLSNLSSRLAPLYQLLKQKVNWKWTKVEETTFRESKKPLLTSDQLLVHSQPTPHFGLRCLGLWY